MSIEEYTSGYSNHYIQLHKTDQKFSELSQMLSIDGLFQLHEQES